MPVQNAAPASHGQQITTSLPLEDFNVLAAFDSMEDASRAIRALGRAGIDGQRLTLQGDAPNAAASQMDVAAADAGLLGRWFTLSTLWGLAGIPIGAVLAVPVGAFGLAVSGREIAFLDLLASAVMGAIFGGIIMWLIGVMLYGQGGDAWELGYHETADGTTVVGVQSSHSEEVRTARDILRRHGGRSVRTLGPSTTPRRAVDITGRGA